MKLRLLEDNRTLSELNLELNKEFTIGRSSDCDLKLDSETGISRKHIKVKLLDDDTLLITLLSKLGELVYNEEIVEELTIPVGESFHIKQFQFIFINEEPLTSVQENIKPEVKISNNETDNEVTTHLNRQSIIDATKPLPHSELSLTEKLPNSNDPDDSDGNDEQTLTASTSLVVTLHLISRSTGKIKDSYSLDGNHWLIGRDESSSLPLNFSFISRSHFELTKTSEGFYIFDLGSSNGTLVNDKKLPAKEHIQIYNDDIIKIKTLGLKVELKDENFDQKISLAIPEEETNVNFNHNFQRDSKNNNLRLQNNNKKNSGNKKLLFIRASIVLIILFGLYAYKNDKKKTSLNLTKQQNLPNKQNQLIASDIYNMAQNFYSQKENLSCLNELERLHNLVPEFKDSKRMENLCKQGLEIEQEQKIKEERNFAAKKIEAESNKLAKICEEKYSSFKSRLDLDNCLNSLIVLNPTHPIINALQERWENEQQSIVMEKERIQSLNQFKQEGIFIFNRAKRDKSKGRLRKSLASFQKYVRNNYPGNKQKSIAKREIASLKAQINQVAKTLISNCQQDFNRKEYKSSYYSCQKVLKQFPNNEEAEQMRIKSLKKLRSIAKTLYSDGALEESLGNIAAAKEKWNQILKTHIKTDEYYQKATRKLKKYDNGI